MRDAGQEVSLHGGALPPASSMSIAAMLLGRITSPTLAARRAELRVRLQDVLNSMETVDREILTLRHFEELGNTETAQVLGISKAAASSRYIRAVMRLKKELAAIPGFIDT
jgi:RNA polymerase sigma-70 factor (ECF subfamily)